MLFNLRLFADLYFKQATKTLCSNLRVSGLWGRRNITDDAFPEFQVESVAAANHYTSEAMIERVLNQIKVC